MKKPIIHAFLAALYIATVASLMQFISSIRHDTPDTVLDVVAALSLFVFSAVVMAYLFFAKPLFLYIDGDKKGALSFFLNTLLSFGVITVLSVGTMLLTAEPGEGSVRKYVAGNLSALSPEKEVLGGTFYITEFEAKDGEGFVAYEDGHVAYAADFLYEIEDGNVLISSFTIRSE